MAAAAVGGCRTIQRSLESKLREGVTPEDYGTSVGTGGDDSAAFTLALDAAVINPAINF